MATDDRSEIQIRSRWGEIDSNGHMRNVAYLDISANARMEFFNANGYTLTEFFGAGIGPVVLKDEIEYKREVRLAEDLTVTNELAGMSEDNTRFIFRNQFIKANGNLIATETRRCFRLDSVAVTPRFRIQTYSLKMMV